LSGACHSFRGEDTGIKLGATVEEQAAIPKRVDISIIPEKASLATRVIGLLYH
jgi:hypothetical protein